MTTTVRHRNTFGRRLKKWFGDSELSKSVLRPILVNVGTAILLFAGALACKGPFLKLLGIEGPSQYPLCWVLEPVWDPVSHQLNAELYIVNRTGEVVRQQDLEDALKIHADADEAERSTTWFKLRYKAKRDSIVSVDFDEEFNAGKGLLRRERLDAHTWAVIVENIEDRAALKVRIRTSTHVPTQISRASRQSLPFEVLYPGP